MKIVFLGYAVNAMEAEGLSGVSIAGNKMQLNVLSELSKYDDLDIKILTIYPVAAWPRDKRLFYNGEREELVENVFTWRVNFLNLPILKQIWQTISLFWSASRLVDKETLVFTFNMFPQVGIPAVLLKKFYGCKMCSLLADLPIDDNTFNKSYVRKMFRKLFDWLTRKAIRKCDKLVVLNKHAALEFAPGIPYIVVEGGVAEKDIRPFPNIVKNRKVIVYSGALTEYSGILQLIEAMKYVDDPDVTLEIYGGGYLKEEVVKRVEQSSNIRYMGRVSNSEMLKIQEQAWLLVNPRLVDDPISKVTFPSKLFEYMLSGTPVLTTKFNGLSNEYFSKLFIIENEPPTDIAININKILNKTQEECDEISKAAYFFIINSKMWAYQVQKIIKFIY